MPGLPNKHNQEIENFSHAKFLIEFEKCRKKVNKFPLDTIGVVINNDSLNRVIHTEEVNYPEPYIVVDFNRRVIDSDFLFTVACNAFGLHLWIEDGFLSFDIPWTEFVNEKVAAEQAVGLIQILSNGQIQLVLTMRKNKVCASELIFWNKDSSEAETIYRQFKYPTFLNPNKKEGYEVYVKRNSSIDTEYSAPDEHFIHSEVQEGVPTGRLFKRGVVIEPLTMQTATTMNLMLRSYNKNGIRPTTMMTQILHWSIIFILTAQLVSYFLPIFLSRIDGSSKNIIELGNENGWVLLAPIICAITLSMAISKKDRDGLKFWVSLYIMFGAMIYANFVVGSADDEAKPPYDAIGGISFLMITLVVFYGLATIMPRIINHLQNTPKMKLEFKPKIGYAVSCMVVALVLPVGGYITFSTLPDQSMNYPGLKWLFIAVSIVVAVFQLILAHRIAVGKRPDNFLAFVGLVSLFGILSPAFLIKDGAPDEGSIVGWLLTVGVILIHGLILTAYGVTDSIRAMREIENEIKLDSPKR